MKFLLIISLFVFIFFHTFSSENTNFIQYKLNSNHSLNLISNNSIDNNQDKENFFKKQGVYYSFSIAMLTVSSVSLISSFVFGGLAFFENNDFNKLLFRTLSLSLYSFSLLTSIIPSILLISNLINYFTKYPDEYLKKYYTKIRNILIIMLCMNSNLGLVSFIVSNIFLYNAVSDERKFIKYGYLSANFGYISGVSLFVSISLSIILIIKHCLYKYYNKPENKTFLKKQSAQFYPLFDIKNNDRIVLGFSVDLN